MLCILFIFLNSDSLILNSDIRYKRIALSIAYWETGNYTSRAYKYKNNLFGFSTNKGVIKYRNKKASVIAYEKYEAKMIKKYNIKSEKEYLDRISKSYAKSNNRKLWKKKILRNLKKVGV